jgi:hypothetical protein
MALQVQPSGAASGTATVSGTTSTGTITCSFLGSGIPGGGTSTAPADLTSPLTGTSSSLAFTETVAGSDQGANFSWTMAFTGSVSSGVVTGTLRETYTWGNIPNVTVYGGNGTTTVTLR